MEENKEEEEEKKFGMDLKIIIVGDISTGKTSIINRYINEKFETLNKTTLSPEFSYKIVKSNGTIFRIQFWDIPGQNRNPELTGVFCRDSQGIIFCTEVDNLNSRENINIWENSLKQFNDIKDTPKILLENKCDLLGDESHYNDDFDKLKTFSDEHDFSGCFRTSALNGYNVNKAIDFIINEIIKSIEEEDIQFYNSKIKVNETYYTNEQKNKNRCC